jgi:hypothetical protein
LWSDAPLLHRAQSSPKDKLDPTADSVAEAVRTEHGISFANLQGLADVFKQKLEQGSLPELNKFIKEVNALLDPNLQLESLDPKKEKDREEFTNLKKSLPPGRRLETGVRAVNRDGEMQGGIIPLFFPDKA